MGVAQLLAAQPESNPGTAPYDDVLAHPEAYYQVRSVTVQPSVSPVVVTVLTTSLRSKGADVVWVTISSALVFLMVPSLSLIYAGTGNRTSAMQMFRLPMITCAVVGFQVSSDLFEGYRMC